MSFLNKFKGEGELWLQTKCRHHFQNISSKQWLNFSKCGVKRIILSDTTTYLSVTKSLEFYKLLISTSREILLIKIQVTKVTLCSNCLSTILTTRNQNDSKKNFLVTCYLHLTKPNLSCIFCMNCETDLVKIKLYATNNYSVKLWKLVKHQN